MSTLHPKFSVSVYSEGHEFNKDAYDVSRGFAIHTLKRVEPTQTLTEKFKLSLTSSNWKDTLSPQSRKLVKTLDGPKTLVNDNGSPAESPFEGTYEVKSPNSKFKAKLEKDVYLANQIEAEASAQNNYIESYRQDEKDKTRKQKLENSALIGSPYRRNQRPLIGYSTGRSTRNKMRSTYGDKDFIKMRTKSSALQHTLYYDTRTSSIPKTSLKNPVIDELIDKEDFIMTNPALLESIVKLRDMNLLKQNSPSVNRYKGIGKVDYVYNDFHSRSTNPGYSRNTGGVFYFR